MDTSREQLLASAEQNEWDVIVIGGGINGAGIARDAAMRGLRTLIVDAGDWASGTTSWSTRLIHGGLRYLEYYEVPLVRESLREREILLHIAPHLVEPLAFVLPVYEGNYYHTIPFQRGTRYSMPDLYMAMFGYDVLSYDKSLPNHKMYSAAQLLEIEPGLSPKGLRGGAVYYDGQITFPERLTLENILSARMNGAVALNYVRAEQLQQEDGRVRSVTLQDTLSDRTLTARGRFVINCAGPWVDRALDALGVKAKQQIGGTKGTHVVVRPFPGAPTRALYIAAPDDRRQFFIVPWQGLYLIGTTDTRFDGDLDAVHATQDEVDYLLRSTNHTIPDAHLTEDDVLYTYSGVRPLPYVEEGAAGAITRRHVLHYHAKYGGPEGLLSIIGGKITTYRSLAEEAVDFASKHLGINRHSRTAKTPLPGAAWGSAENIVQTHGAQLQQRFGLDRETVDQLAHLYGAQLVAVLASGDTGADLRQRLPGERPLIGAQLVYAVEHEQAHNLRDALMRRTMMGFGPERGLPAVTDAATLLGRYCNWDATRVRDEIEDYQHTVKELLPKPDELAAVQGDIKEFVRPH